jgi:formyl-CoA transferase
MVDMGTGLYSAIALLMALQERTRSGKGQYIDMTLYDCAVSLMHPHVPNYYLSGKTPGLTGNQHTNVVPYDRFHTKTVDIFIGAGNQRAFQRLCAVIGNPGLAEDPRFKDNTSRVAHREALTATLTEILAEKDGEDICRKLLEGGVPAGPVLDTAQVMTSAQTQHRKMAASLDWYKGTGIPIKFSRTPGSVRRTPPKFGVHGHEILAEHGFSEEEIARLAEAGVLVEKRRP